MKINFSSFSFSKKFELVFCQKFTEAKPKSSYKHDLEEGLGRGGIS